MKSNNKGFAIATVLYGLLVLFLLLVIFMLGIIYSYKHRIDRLIADDRDGAKAILNKRVKDLNKTSFKINDTDKVRCNKREIDYQISVDDTLENQGYDHLLQEVCFNNCYFFIDDVTCTPSMESVYNCNALIYDECEKVADDYQITDRYENKLPYSGQEE